MLDHDHALATMEDNKALTMENLELEGVNIFYTGVVVWDSKARVTVLLTRGRYLVFI